MQKKQLVVIGGGAAGFFCAVNAARIHPHIQVTLVEKTSKLLSKVKVSGGGRCNVTHACFSMADMIKKYPRGSAFLKKAFHHFFTTDTIAWFESRGVKIKAEDDGRMFPVTDNSQTIIDCLLSEASKYKVQIMMNAEVKEIFKTKQKGQSDRFTIILKNENVLNADYVCIASGGYAKYSQFEWINKLGHHIASPVPSLFTFNLPGNKITSLMGIAVENVQVKIAGTKLQQQGPLLITHWGLSGPAILKLSAWGAGILAEKNYNYQVVINWLPEYHENSMIEKLQGFRFSLASQKIVNRNPFLLPSRLWEYFLSEVALSVEMRWADLPAKTQNKLAKILCAQEFEVKGKTTFKEEFVTAGGVELSEINASSMQSKLVPGLYFAGEAMNVDGITGGYNFQHAWTSGWIAANLK
ncbi:MAG: NAD(P)/FAD-dependent oxidoreductase [Ferruginibacter sp.]